MPTRGQRNATWWKVQPVKYHDLPPAGASPRSLPRRMRRGSFILRASQRASFTAQQAAAFASHTAIPFAPLAMVRGRLCAESGERSQVG